MMPSKEELLAKLRSSLDKWVELLASKTEEQLTTTRFSGNRSVADIVAHLAAWQQLSVARLEAALLDADPIYPGWLAGKDPFFANEHVDEFNARIYDMHHEEAWSDVHATWRERFLQFIELAKAIPDTQLFDEKRYAWMRGYPLSAVLEGSCEHHEEHYSGVIARLPPG